MNLQQLHYIVAVDEHRHFQRAADACNITPATLSMMIKKLEQELDVIIFDRSKYPIIPTDLGNLVIEKARIVLHHVDDLIQVVKDADSEISGEVRIGIIPTLSPYLTHLFLPVLVKKYPKLKIKLHEWNTNQIVDSLIHGRLDIGIAATPLNLDKIKERPLFQEELVAYVSENYQADSKKYIAPEDIDMSKLWLMEEEHCLRSQVTNLCQLKKIHNEDHQVEFEAGSIETLINMVSINEGITVVPELIIDSLPLEKQKSIKHFTAPIPVRQISLITYRHFVKEKLLKVLEEEILKSVEGKISNSSSDKKIVDI